MQVFSESGSGTPQKLGFEAASSSLVFDSANVPRTSTEMTVNFKINIVGVSEVFLRFLKDGISLL